MNELGHCCYGGLKPREKCASCSLWRRTCSTLCHPKELCSISEDGKCSMENKPSCWNRPPFKESLKVQDGWTEDGRRNMISYPTLTG